MILKEKDGDIPEDIYAKAGFDAEKNMAFYLSRAFAESVDIRVFNDLRLERKGEIAQIDHLVLHRFGFVLIESKSVSSAIEVNAELEFVRIFGRERRGMQSPIQQVKLQCGILSKILDDNKASLRRKMLFGLKQGGFGEERFNRIVAISDRGEIIRRGASPPELIKADSVTDKVTEIIHRHQRTLGLSGTLRMAVADSKEARQLDKDYLPPFSDEELELISKFLLQRHNCKTKLSSQVPKLPVKPALPEAVSQITREGTLGSFDQPSAIVHRCRQCSSTKLEIVYGKYGYYFKCSECSGNSNIAAVCAKCSAKAKISKTGSEFTSICNDCGNEAHFHTNSQSDAKR